MGDLDGAMAAYEQALRHNQWSIPAMTAILQQVLKLDPQSGETWGSLGTYSRYINQIILV